MKKTMMCLTLAMAMLLCAACGKQTEPPVTEPPQEQTQEQTTPPEPVELTPEPEDETPDEEPEPEDDETEPEDDETDWTEEYAPVLDALCDALYNGVRDIFDDPLVPNGVLDIVNGYTGADAVERVGYAFVDLNGDDEPELLVADGEDILIGGYSLVRGEPHRFLDGWYRSAYLPLEDGRIYYHGSGGAAYAIFGVYHLSEDGRELECEDYYFSDIAEGSDYDLVFYHNTTGEWDTEASERFAGTENEFWAKADELSEGCKMPELTPLSDYDYTGVLNQPLDCLVRADYLDEVEWQLGDHEDWRADLPSDEYSVTLVFRAREDVRDFKLLTLELKDVDESGKPDYRITELWRTEELKAGVPLTADVSFPGDIPTSGFSYIAHGVKRWFTLSQSGRDGALVVTAIN